MAPEKDGSQDTMRDTPYPDRAVVVADDGSGESCFIDATILKLQVCLP